MRRFHSPMCWPSWGLGPISPSRLQIFEGYLWGMTLKIGLDRAAKRATAVESQPELSYQLLLFRPHNSLHRSVCRNREPFSSFFTCSGSIHFPLFPCNLLCFNSNLRSCAVAFSLPSPRSLDKMLRSGQAMKAVKALAQRQPCHSRALTTSSTISKVTTSQQKVPATMRNKATAAAA